MKWPLYKTKNSFKFEHNLYISINYNEIKYKRASIIILLKRYKSYRIVVNPLEYNCICIQSLYRHSRNAENNHLNIAGTFSIEILSSCCCAYIY